MLTPDQRYGDLDPTQLVVERLVDHPDQGVTHGAGGGVVVRRSGPPSDRLEAGLADHMDATEESEHPVAGGGSRRGRSTKHRGTDQHESSDQIRTQISQRHRHPTTVRVAHHDDRSRERLEDWDQHPGEVEG